MPATSVNSSTEYKNRSRPQEGRQGYQNFFEVDYDTCLIILSVLVVGINVLVLTLFARRRYLRTKTNTLLASLAVSDLMMGLFGIPSAIACNALVLDPKLSPVLCYGSVVTFRFISISTILHIFTITIERYISVVYPFRYIVIATRKRILVTISVVWVFSSFLALVQLSWQGNLSSFIGQEENATRQRFNVIYNFSWFVIFFVLPSCIMTIIYYRIFKVIRHQAKEIRRLHNVGQVIHDNPPASSPRQPAMPTETRAVIIFALMLGIFVVCWLTWYMGGLQEYKIVDSIAIDEVWYMVFDFFRFSTSFINPLLYTFLKLDFRQALVSFLPCCKANQRMKRYTAATQEASAVWTTLADAFSSVEHSTLDFNLSTHVYCVQISCWCYLCAVFWLLHEYHSK